MSFNNNILKWIEYDNKIKDYNNKLKLLKDKKNDINTDIINYVINNDLTDKSIQILNSDIELKYNKSISYEGITYKYLEKCFNDFFKEKGFTDNDLSNELIDHIKNNRQSTYKEYIKRFKL